jgi:actin-related protein
MNVAEAAEYGGEMRSLSVCMEWQEEILREAFKTELHLTSAAALTQYSVCLVVPDCWHSSEISAFLTLLLCRLDFTAVFLLRESVATAYGAGLATACVVDLGAFGTRVACVEEGVVMQRTVRYLNYGSADIEGVIAHSVQEHQLWTRMENAVRAAAQKGEWDRESMLVLRRAEQLRLWKEHFSYFLTSSADDTSSLIQQPVLAYSHSPSEVPTAVPEELQFAAVLGPLAYFYPSLFHTALRTLDDPHRARILEKMKAREDPYAELLPSSVVNSAATTLVEGNVLFDPTGAMLEEELQLLATETNESVLERSKKITAAPPPAPEAATKKSDETAAPPDATTSSTDAAPVFRLDRRRKDHQLLLERYTESELLSGAHLKSEAEEERKQKEIATFRLDRRRKDHQMLLERYTEEQLMAGQHLKDAEEERKEKEKKEQALLQQQQQQQDAAMNTSDPSSAAGTPSTVHRRLSSLVASSAHSHPPRTAVESFLAHREPLHLAIARSIQAAAATVAGERGREQGEASGLQLQCKLATSIILTGGGSNLPRVLPAVEERLVDVFPYLLPGVPSVACLLHPKGLDSHQLSWRGGAIVARGEGSHGKDMWLTSEEWRRHGVRLLREKASWMVV